MIPYADSDNRFIVFFFPFKDIRGQLILECDLLADIIDQLVDLYSFLLHGISVSNSYRSVSFGIEIIGNTEGCSDFILSSVSLSYSTSVIVLTVIIF